MTSPTLPLCSECGQPFSPDFRNVAKQITCGRTACQISRIKSRAVMRPATLRRGHTLAHRARKRKADNQRELEFALAGWGPEPVC